MEKKRYTLGSEIKIPADIRSWAEQHKTVAGIYETVFQGRWVYLLAAGECPTGGYGIKVTETPERSGALTYQKVCPGQEDFVIEIITYPYELVFSEEELRISRD
jgi:hypothetical protein